MIETTSFFENNDSGKFTNLGSSPDTLLYLMHWMKEKAASLLEVRIALYLFNNRAFYDFLNSPEMRHCKVVVYSIPLEGYDTRNPLPVYDFDSGHFIERASKYDFAERLYSSAKVRPFSNVLIRIVPHMYLRSSRVNSFSRGQMPYSLHCKCFYARCADGKNYFGLSSTNFALRDAGKMETMTVISLNDGMDSSAKDFFSGLDENSYPLDTFDESADWSHYEVKLRPVPSKSNLMFVAPFYKYSACIFEENLQTMIRRAQSRIVICAQHVSSYKYSYERLYEEGQQQAGVVRKEGFLSDVLAQAQRGLDTTILSQTYVDAGGSRGCRAPQNKKSFIDFAEAAKRTHCNHFVNENIHCKFLLIDDIAVVTTCNLTPTQFIYLPNVRIDKFVNMPGASYSGVHCEVGAYFAARCPELVAFLERVVDEIIRDQNTRRMY